MVLPLFCDGLVEHLGFQAFFGVHLFKPSVFFFELLQSGHHGDIHAAEFGPPLVKCGITHAMFPAQLGYGCAGLGLVQYIDDLTIGIA